MRSPAAPLSPALAGHAFQQTALIGMLPLVAERLGLSQAAIGWTVAAGMLASALASPVLGARGGRAAPQAALAGLLLSSSCLALLIAWPPASAGIWLLPALLAIRATQGVSASVLLMLAQSAARDGMREGAPEVGTVAAAQSAAGWGRLAGALTVGPLAVAAAAAPLVPAPAGALASLLLLRRAPLIPPEPRRLRPPQGAALVAPILAQAGLGAAQIALAPALAAALSAEAAEAAGLAGLCLAAATLGLLAAHRWITPRLRSVAAARRPAALTTAAAALLLPFAEGLAGFAALSALIGAASALILAGALHRAMAARPEARTASAGWNGAAQLLGLALGVGLGSVLLPLSPNAPFFAAASFAILLAAAPHPSKGASDAA